MPGYENLSASELWRSGRPIEHTPAFPYGHIRDVERIAWSSGRSVKEVQAMIESRQIEVPNYLPQDWETAGEQKEG